MKFGFLKSGAVFLAATTLLAGAAAASTKLVLAEVGDEVAFDDAFATISGTVNDANLSSTISWDLVSVDTTTLAGSNEWIWNVEVNVANNSDDDPNTANDNRLVAWGFSTDATSYILESVADFELANSSWSYDTSISTGVDGYGQASFDICILDGSNCTGGGNSGILPGNDQTFSFGLVAPDTDNELDLVFYYTRYQTVGTPQSGFQDSAKLVANCPKGSLACPNPGTPPNPIPLPAGLPLLASGLAIGAFVARRKKKAA